MTLSPFQFTSRLVGSLALAATLAGMSGRALMAEPLWMDVSEVVSVEVIQGWTEPDGTRLAGLRFTLEPGWKTYWRQAGAAGISPRLNWEASENARNVSEVWPVPSVFRQGDLLAFGYETDFVLPLVIVPQATADDVVLAGTLDLGVCADICLPARLDIKAVLDATGVENPILRTALNDVPDHVAGQARCQVVPTSTGFSLNGQINLPSMGGHEAVVFEIPDTQFWVTDADVLRNDGQISATSDLITASRDARAPRPDDIRITVIGTSGATEINGCAE